MASPKLTTKQRLAKWTYWLRHAHRMVRVLRVRLAKERAGKNRVLKGRGPDVSNYQGTVDWRKVKAGGATFGVCKATEGTTYNDPTFTRNWPAMKSAGLRRVAYHFARPAGNSAVNEARHFAAVVERNGFHPEAGDLLVLDAEVENGPNYDKWCDQFFRELQRLVGPVPEIVYTYAPFRAWAPRPHRRLWIAAYGRSFSLPSGWQRSQLIAWQYTNAERWPGIKSPCDSNRAL